jgi:hypothetical protein
VSYDIGLWFSSTMWLVHMPYYLLSTYEVVVQKLCQIYISILDGILSIKVRVVRILESKDASK